ncbi:hypothetical protein CAL7716_100390 (plasmid) [Calothrix sp. PCC 7716]|nr:hypothetical protein CAL7716_100390 [Calothrix sp. PCC 7716]
MIVRNLEALLCRQVRAGVYSSKTIQALDYFNTAGENQALILKDKDALSNSCRSRVDQKSRLFQLRYTLATAARDAFAIIGATVFLNALLSGGPFECNASHTNKQLWQPSSQPTQVNQAPSNKGR